MLINTDRVASFRRCGEGRFVFGEDYMRFKHILSIGTFVHLTGRVQKKKYGDEMEFKVANLELLTELREKRARTLLLKVESSDLTEESIDALYHLIQDHAGNCSLKFIVRDFKSRSEIKMPSRNIKVSVDNDFIKKVDELKIFDCKIE